MGLIKTSILVTGGVLLGGALLLGTGPLSSYLRTSARVASENVHDAVPVTFEIERIQTLVGDLDAVIAEHQAQLVKQRVDLKYLQQEVARNQQKMLTLEDEVQAARTILTVHQANYQIGDKSYDRAVVMQQAKNKAESLIRTRGLLEAKQQTLTTLNTALQQAGDQLAQARGQRETYSIRLAELRAMAGNVAIRKELVTQLQDLPNNIDSGAFQEVEQAFQRVERELEVQDRMLQDAFTSTTSTQSKDAINFSKTTEPDVLATLDKALRKQFETDPVALSHQKTDQKNVTPIDADPFATESDDKSKPINADPFATESDNKATPIKPTTLGNEDPFAKL